MFTSRATAIEMVTTLAHSQHGRQYLAQQGIMDKISNMIRGAETDPFSSLYLPGEGIHTHSVQVGQLQKWVIDNTHCSFLRFSEVLWKLGHHGQPTAGLWNLPGFPEQSFWDGPWPRPCHERRSSGHFGFTRLHCGGKANTSEDRSVFPFPFL